MLDDIHLSASDQPLLVWDDMQLYILIPGQAVSVVEILVLVSVKAGMGLNGFSFKNFPVPEI